MADSENNGCTTMAVASRLFYQRKIFSAIGKLPFVAQIFSNFRQITYEIDESYTHKYVISIAQGVKSSVVN